MNNCGGNFGFNNCGWLINLIIIIIAIEFLTQIFNGGGDNGGSGVSCGC
jgi:hypothetical protein